MPRQLSERNRRRILEAARLLFGTRGFHATSVSDIARELSMGHGTVYRYFESKETMLEQVVAEALGKVTSVTLGRDPTSPTTLAEHAAQVDALGRELFASFMHDAAGVRLVFDEAPALGSSVRRRAEGALAHFAAFTRAYLDNGVARGYLRPDCDTEAAALALSAVVFEGIRATVAAADPQAEADRWIRTYQMLASGLAHRYR